MPSNRSSAYWPSPILAPERLLACAALLTYGLCTAIANAAPKAAVKTSAAAKAPDAEADDDSDSEDQKPVAEHQDKDKEKEKETEKAEPAETPAATASAAAAPVSAVPKASALPASPLTVQSGGWTASVYGFAELDILGDSTQSFGEGALNNTLARPNTVAGDNPRTQLTARNSRFGFRVAAPEWNAIKASAVVEMDFMGEEPPALKQNESYTSGPMRMRHYYAKLETPVLDVIAGQYHDVFGWGGAGFYPNTVAFLPLLGQIYHRNPQFRLSKTLASEAADFEIAAAVVRPVQRDAAVPDFQGGVRLNVNGWSGASAPGASRPTAAPLSLGLSGVVRRLSVADFSATPGNPQTASAWGFAANAFVPVIPANHDDLSNALSLTAEYSVGSGISDLYPGLTGGVGFPALPNPNNEQAPPTYLPNIDPGIATFDAQNQLKTVAWRALVIGGHYHLPVAQGKALWLSATYSLLQSSNALSLTPVQSRYFVWDKGQYFDANVWWGVTPAVQVGLSFQNTRQTFGDGTVAKNNRGQAALYFFF